MAKYYGIIGFVKSVESAPSVWIDKATERKYYGDVIRNSRQWQLPSEGVNDNLNINNSISIVADPYAKQNFQHIKYCKWNGAVWKVSDVIVEYPRIILSIGGVYNGKTADTRC